MAKAKMILHHDDPPCEKRLTPDGYCAECTFVPDMQSTCFWFYCPSCDRPLKDMRCCACGGTFERPDR